MSKDAFEVFILLAQLKSFTKIKLATFSVTSCKSIKSGALRIAGL